MHGYVQSIYDIHEYVRRIKYMHECITATHHLRHSLFNKLAINTYLNPEAQNWTDLNYSL